MNKTTEHRIVFQPSGRAVYVLPGTTLLEAAARAGLVLQTPCGGGGTCGKCRVRVYSGQTSEAAAAPHRLPPKQAAEGWRLACSTRVAGEAVVEVPSSSMFETTQRILTSDAGHRLSVAPAVAAIALSLPPPTREDDRPDVARIEAQVGRKLDFPPTVLAGLPGQLRRNRWSVHLVHEGDRILALLPGDAPARTLGVAFDLGTTTVVGTLLDLASGQELGVSSTLNGQIPFGDDVLSRIQRVRERPDRLEELQQAAAGSLNAIAAELLRTAGARAEQVVNVTLAGNTTMQQIVCGIDPSALGEIPFAPAFARGINLPAACLGLDVNPAARVYVFPQVGGFVGGDTVSGMLAAGFDRLTRPVLLVDIGTNGEIALLHGDRILCASTAAGPAFEGARIAQGMRATTGAIEKVVVVDGEMLVNVIGNAPAAGLCGTALIDAVAEMLRHGLLDTTGRILAPDELPAATPPDLRRRLVADDGDSRLVLAAAAEGGVEISLRQRDVRELQLASGAIRAGIDALLQRAGLGPNDLEAVLLAGAFGNFIRRSNAQRIGLLPPLPHERIRFIGNASSMGAKMALVSTAERARAERLRERSQHVDLSSDPGFQMAFGMAMIFPE
jgi:uncharacterized 2Fe-2S/4Fe-4S cluster protein (DUF4445 family)